MSAQIDAFLMVGSIERLMCRTIEVRQLIRNQVLVLPQEAQQEIRDSLKSWHDELNDRPPEERSPLNSRLHLLKRHADWTKQQLDAVRPANPAMN